MKRVVHITESQLKTMISKIIEEQTMSQSFQQGQKSGYAAGQKVQQAVKGAANTLVQGAKQIVIKIGNTIFTCLITGAAIVFLIGKGLFKVSQIVGNAILKFLSATGKAIVGATTALTQATINLGISLGIAWNKGTKWVEAKLASLADSTLSTLKWVINQFKQFGIEQWGKVLVAAANVREFGSMIGGFLKQSWDTIKDKVGVAWENAKSWASGQWNKLKQGAANMANRAASAVSSTAKSIGSGIATGAGALWGGIKGLFSEMVERYLSFKGKDTMTILSECRKFNTQVI